MSNTIIDPRRVWATPDPPNICRPLALPPGMLYRQGMVHYLHGPLEIKAGCADDQPYIYTNMAVVNRLPPLLTSSTDAWEGWLAGSGSYSRSVPVLITTFSCALTVSIAVSSLVSGASTRRFPWLLRIAVYYATVHLIVAVALLFKITHEQFNIGYTSSFIVSQKLFTRPLIIASYVSAILLLLAQVRVAMELFGRRLERHLAGAIGLSLVVVAMIMWGVAQFGDQQDIVPNVIEYLFELAVYILFSGSMVLACVENWRAVCTRDLGLLTLLAMLVSMLPAALFVADMAGWYVGRMVDQICQISNLITVVVAWYWTQILADTRQTQEAEYPLGKRIYEGDDGERSLYFTDAEALRDDKASSEDGADAESGETFAEFEDARSWQEVETASPPAKPPPRAASAPLGWWARLATPLSGHRPGSV